MVQMAEISGLWYQDYPTVPHVCLVSARRLRADTMLS